MDNAAGLKTDKGFKDAQLNQVAKMVTQFSNRLCTGQQVYNHLRFWRARWVKVQKLRQMSGAGWDEDNFMICLEQEHYDGVVQAHPKDAEFLNRPIQNYHSMQVIFGSGTATGKYAMGSSEPLGNACDAAAPVDVDAYEGGKEPEEAGPVHSKHGKEKAHERKEKAGRKRKVHAEEGEGSGGICGAINGLSSTMGAMESCPGIYRAVMDVEGFSRPERMLALDHFMTRKTAAMVFMEMSEADKVLWVQMFLAKQGN